MKKRMIVHSLETLERNFGSVITSEKQFAKEPPPMPNQKLEVPAGLMTF